MEEALSPPNDAEVKILGGLLFRPKSLAQVVDLLHPEDFFQERHQVIYTTLLSLSQQHSPVDLLTVCEVLQQQGNLSGIGGVEYIASLCHPVEKQEMIKLAASLHRRAAARRRLLSAGERIQHLARTEPDETIAFEKATQLLAQVKWHPVTVASPLAELLVESTQELSQARTRSGELTGVPTSFDDLDTLPDGLQPSDSSDTCGSAALTSAAMAAFDRLDTTVRRAVAYLLPKGVSSFVAHLLLEASIKQVDIPSLGLVEAFVVCLPNIESFAQQHRQSKDTAYRYIDMLEALRIVFRSRAHGATTVSLPLTPWKPTVDALVALEALEVPGAARKKLQQLASSVRKRFLLLYGDPSRMGAN